MTKRILQIEALSLHHPELIMELPGGPNLNFAVS